MNDFRATPNLAMGLGFLLLVGCTSQEKQQDSIRLVGHADNFLCDDPAYATVKKVVTFEIRSGDGQKLDLCRPAPNAFSAADPCPDFRCEGPSQYRDLVLEFDAKRDDASNALAMYQKARQARNMTDAWTAIQLLLRADPIQADELWKEFWQSEVLPRYSNRPDRALEALNAAAERGFASAMVRLSEVYSKGEFGVPANSALAAQWKKKASVARAVQRTR
jgi:hypothetical protein